LYQKNLYFKNKIILNAPKELGTFFDEQATRPHFKFKFNFENKLIHPLLLKVPTVMPRKLETVGPQKP
jgi:hypothetical protein